MSKWCDPAVKKGEYSLGLYQQRHHIKIARCHCLTVYHIGQTTPGILCAILEASLQKGRGQDRESTEESDEDDPGPGDQEAL